MSIVSGIIFAAILALENRKFLEINYFKSQIKLVHSSSLGSKQRTSFFKLIDGQDEYDFLVRIYDDSV